MTIWIDAQILPALARWLSERFAIESRHVKELDLVEASGPSIFQAAKLADAVVLTKDRDFITCGNTSNREMVRILGATFEKAYALLVAGEAVVEIKG
jgi:predicted nuclease of predicted toxin-antitoxin system